MAAYTYKAGSSPLAWLIAPPNFKTTKVTRSLFPGVLRSRCLEALRHDTKTRLSISRECSLRSSLFRFLSGKRESREGTRTEVTKNWWQEGGAPFLFLLSPHAFARLLLGSRFLPLRGNGKDCYAGYQLTNKICFTPSSGFQSFFSVFTQISPLLATFGWKIFVKKNPEKTKR